MKSNDNQLSIILFILIVLINLQLSSKAIDLNHIKDTKKDTLCYHYHELAKENYKENKISQAIINEKKAYIYAIKEKKIDSKFIQKSKIQLGYYYKKEKNYLKSISAYNDAIAIDDDNSIVYKAYYNNGTNYKKIYNYNKSIEYYKHALILLKENKNKKSVLRNLYYNLANVYLQLGSTLSIKESIKYIKKADSISNVIKTSNNIKYLIKINYATNFNLYNNLDIDIASDYFNQALNIARIDNDSLKICEVYNSLGSLYNTTDFKKSIRYLNLAEKYTKKSDSFILHQINNNYSITFAHNSQHGKSIDFAKKSLTYLLGHELDEMDLNHTKNTLINSKYLLYFKNILPSLAEIYLKYYEETNNVEYLKKSIQYFELVDFVINLLKENSSEFKSKLFWRSLSADIYGKAIRASYLNNDLAETFYYMEKNKALILMEDITNQLYKKTLSISKELLSKENQIKKNIFQLRLKLITENHTKRSKDSIYRVLSEKDVLLVNLQDSIYGKIERKKEIDFYSIYDIQKDLKKNEILIEYHISLDDGYGIYTNNQYAYALFISKELEYLFEIPGQTQLQEDIKQLLQLIKKPFTSIEKKEEYNKLSYKIYKTLFPTEEIRKLIKGKNLQIIADNYLTLLPFEALITNEDTPEYFIESNEISYEYSLSFSQLNKKLKRNPLKDFIGFAPIRFKNDSLSTLYHSEKELKQINRILDGDLFLYEAATKNTFLKEMNSTKIIHLATHAESNNRISPWIAFKDSILYLDELYMTHNQSDLTVLSACNTSTGELVTGEGVLSLARGFFYSGTKSVVSSLWNTDDKATGYITKEFYKYLKNGDTKSSALRKSKLKYLKTQTLSQQSPFYWAPLILVGDTSPILFKTDYSLFIYSIVILILFAFIFFIWKRNKK